MNTILNAIRTLGLDPIDITVHATLKHLPAGTKEHYTGAQVPVFEPALTAIRFTHPSQETPVLAWRNSAEHMEDKDAYLAQIQTEPGIDANEARELVAGFTVHYAALTGRHGGVHQIIENDPVLVQKVLDRSCDLKVELVPLLRLIEIESAMIDAIIEDDTLAMDRLDFEKFSLSAMFRQMPCDFALYNELQQEYFSSGKHHAVGKDNYYSWFRQSEAMLDAEGQLSQAAKERFSDPLRAWATAENNLTPEKLEEKQRLARRLFSAHPRHAHLIDVYVHEIALAHAPNAAEKLSEATAPRFSM